MVESRFLHIQIYNSTNTQVEYDNKTDNTWGISAGTAVLERSIMENELKFGSVIANQFEVQVYGIDVKLEKRRIIVTMDYTYDDEGLLKTNADDFLVTNTGDYLKAFNSSEDTEIQLFDGIIDSSKTDNTRTYRDIIAYDRFYVDRDTDISAWWNNYWGLNPDGTVTGSVTTTLGALMSTLLTHMGFTYTKPPMINDSISLKTADMSYYSALTFGEIFSMMCVLQNVCPNIAGDGTLEFINLDSDVSYLHNNAEGLNSYWEDFTTETITGVGVYDTSTELAQLVGTNNNVYCIVANIFLLCQTASNINTICGRILSGLSNITYTPCQLRIVVSKPLDYKLGAKLYTEHGTAYILQDRLSGSLLIDEEIISPAISATLSKDVDPISDNFRQAGKIAQIKRDIDSFKIDYADFKQDVTTEFEQTASTIVLKATTGGRIVKAELGADSATGTSFKVKADDIAFIANGKIELTSNSLQINSTNFKVDASGNITATNADITGKIQSNEGKIGGWEITTEGLEGVSIQMFSGRSGQGYYVPGYIKISSDSSEQYWTTYGSGGVNGYFGGVQYSLSAGSEQGPYLSLYDDDSIFSHKNTNVIYYSWGIVVNRYEEDNARPDFDIALGENGTLNVSGALSVSGALDVTDDLTCGNVNADDVIRSSKWDGTNTSLKSALAGKSSTSHNHDSTYLKLSGGTLTGNTFVKRASGESELGATNTASGKNVYLYAADSGTVGVYSNIGSVLINIDTNKKITIGGTTYGINNPANFRSALGLGNMATQSTSRLILWKMNSRTNITQSNTDDYWTVGQFPAKSGYTRYVMQIQLNNRAMVASYYTLESNNDVRVYTRKLSGTSQTFSIDVICVYLPDANKTT